MNLLPPELEKRFAEIGSQSDKLDPIVVAKYFSPIGAATWYATEYEPNDRIFFGYAKGLVPGDWNDEWGTFSLDELQAVKLPMGLSIERDLNFKEQPITQAVPELKEYLQEIETEERER